MDVVTGVRDCPINSNKLIHFTTNSLFLSTGPLSSKYMAHNLIVIKNDLSIGSLLRNIL